MPRWQGNATPRQDQRSFLFSVFVTITFTRTRCDLSCKAETKAMSLTICSSNHNTCQQLRVIRIVKAKFVAGT